ncbi:MopE-related protein [Sandaracinus amylolyticus]|uniref:MopE-related protein n=1 Tax=Sandaracinus amylolyticus TaxID=927083 RepID=UPI001F2883DC|nr:MopE-related protein [Sandaracinus amylolyticus]UJR85626.1 Hypothetical protein I5071_77060 [Sandaracinus amylolyticus]
MRSGLRLALLLAPFVLVACGDDDAPAMDASFADGPRCTTDEECDDGDFCDGAERCQPSSASADARGCIEPARTGCLEGQICDGEARTCTTDCAVIDDADGDDAIAMECGGDDCDDSDDQRFPSATEVCDVSGRDEDCNASTFGFRDADGDRFGDATCCNGDVCGDDCDDQAPSVNPTGAEICNARDDDCDDLVDEQAGIACWPDLDSDGYARSDSTEVRVCGSCGAQQTSRAPTEGATDCDDATAAVHPGAADDQCDELDNDCDDAIDEDATAASHRLFYVDADGDGFGDASDVGMRVCAASVPGRTLQPGDCDDEVATTYPGAPELCNRLAEDCTAWPSGATTAPARLEEDRDGDGIAAIDATCAGGPYPKLDCADDNVRRVHCDPIPHDVVNEAFQRVRAGDVDADGDVDVVAWTTSAAIVFRNDGTGVTFVREPIGSADPTRAAALVDVDDEGDLDVLTHTTTLGGRLGWYERAPAGTWTWHGLSSSDRTGTSRVPAADVDGDGLVEIAATDGDDLVLWHRVSGAWQRQPIATGVGVQLANPLLVDVDGGGTIEIVVATPDRTWIYRSSGAITGTWTRSDVCQGGEDDLDVFDLEPDGDLDVAFTPSGTFGSVARCTNTGITSTWTGRGVTITGYAEDIEGGDLDRDGDGDVLIAGSAELQWLEGRPLALERHVLAADPPGSSNMTVAIGDLDGDGDNDVVVAQRASTSTGRLYWLEMSGGVFSIP